MFPYHHWLHVYKRVNLLKKNIAGFTGRFMVVTTHSLVHNILYTNIGFAGHSSFTVIKTADPKKNKWRSPFRGINQPRFGAAYP